MPRRTIFSIAATWDPAAKEGRSRTPTARFAVAHAAATSLGGKTGDPNPEELLLAARRDLLRPDVGDLPREAEGPDRERRVSTATCELDKDPAGGFRVTRIDLVPHVPAALWAERQADVEKTLSLAEKYCIVSKAVKNGLALTVTPRPV